MYLLDQQILRKFSFSAFLWIYKNLHNHRAGFSTFDKILLILPKFGKICQKFAKFMKISTSYKISLEFGQNLSEFCHISFLQHFNFLLFSVPRFPFSYHSFQTDPRAGTCPNLRSNLVRRRARLTV